MSEKRHEEKHHEEEHHREEREERRFEHEILEKLDKLAEISLKTFHHLKQQTDLLTQILNGLKPRLGSIAIQVEVSPAPGEKPMPVQGPVLLTSVGQVATATLLYFDTTGAPMPDTFVAPPAIFSVDDPSGAIVSVTDNGDNTATVTDVADGVANLRVTLTSAEGVSCSDSQTVTVANGGGGGTQTLGSVKIAFDGGSPAPAAASQRRR